MWGESRPFFLTTFRCAYQVGISRSSLLFFFFSSRRRHTRFDCDWSSDVCSSDLVNRRQHFFVCVVGVLVPQSAATNFLARVAALRVAKARSVGNRRGIALHEKEIGRASCRERV